MDTFKMNEDFIFGIAASSTQIEGADPNNTWYQWCRKQRKSCSDVCFHACDHWNRVDEDTELLKDLNVQSYRMSLEWSRIEPEKGVFSVAALLHYRNEIQLLLNNRIKPLVTLHHFSEPVWFRELGGWENPRNTELFIDYVRVVVERLGDLVSDWVTFNEPNVYVIFGYLLGIFPPEVRSIIKTNRVTSALIKTHAQVYKLIHKLRTEKRFEGKTLVGPAIHFRIFDGLTFLGRQTASIVDHIFHKRYIEGMAPYSDFLGVNYYTRNIVEFALDPSNYFHKLIRDGDLSKSDIGWDIYPEGLYRICTKYYAEYRLPIYITENGIADRHDKRRPGFIASHLSFLEKAVREGAIVERYYHWTLMDNFEWIFGGAAKFGLHSRNTQTQERTARSSAWLYAQICTKKELTREMIEEFQSGP
jgi:beta-glucosidase